MSALSDPTANATKSSGLKATQHALRELPHTADLFYDLERIGKGTFGMVFKARTKGEHLQNIPKVRARVHCRCQATHQLKGYNHRLQEDSITIQLD